MSSRTSYGRRQSATLVTPSQPPPPLPQFRDADGGGANEQLAQLDRLSLCSSSGKPTATATGWRSGAVSTHSSFTPTQRPSATSGSVYFHPTLGNQRSSYYSQYSETTAVTMNIVTSPSAGVETINRNEHQPSQQSNELPPPPTDFLTATSDHSGDERLSSESSSGAANSHDVASESSLSGSSPTGAPGKRHQASSSGGGGVARGGASSGVSSLASSGATPSRVGAPPASEAQTSAVYDQPMMEGRTCDGSTARAGITSRLQTAASTASTSSGYHSTIRHRAGDDQSRSRLEQLLSGDKLTEKERFQAEMANRGLRVEIASAIGIAEVVRTVYHCTPTKDKQLISFHTEKAIGVPMFLIDRKSPKLACVFLIVVELGTGFQLCRERIVLPEFYEKLTANKHGLRLSKHPSPQEKHRPHPVTVTFFAEDSASDFWTTYNDQITPSPGLFRSSPKHHRGRNAAKSKPVSKHQKANLYEHYLKLKNLTKSSISRPCHFQQITKLDNSYFLDKMTSASSRTDTDSRKSKP